MRSNKLKSLNLNWLSRRDKTLPIPDLVFIDEPSYSGGYVWPGSVWEGDDGEILSTRNGLIEISINHVDQAGIASVIAHEWRHHWQAHNGWDRSPPQVMNSQLSYPDAIRRYFTTSIFEWDALRFERRHAPGVINALWVDMIFSPGNH